MGMLKALETYLSENKVKYQVLPHTLAYTAQEIAALEHVPGRKMAKVVMVKKDGRSVMTVLPAIHHVDLDRLKKAIGGTVELETEREFKDLFAGCEPGAEPPFGNLFDLDVWVDESLTRNDEIVFNAGTHTETVRMQYADFARLVGPKVGEFIRQ
jgi:Ala-tRNA(Pro) deacylase